MLTFVVGVVRVVRVVGVVFWLGFADGECCSISAAVADGQMDSWMAESFPQLIRKKHHRLPLRIV